MSDFQLLGGESAASAEATAGVGAREISAGESAVATWSDKIYSVVRDSLGFVLAATFSIGLAGILDYLNKHPETKASEVIAMLRNTDSWFYARLLLYGIGLAAILSYFGGKLSDSNFARYAVGFGIVYAFMQLALSYKIWLDSKDDTALLTEIRDLLKRR
jgi:hypothetical protein